MANVKKKHYEFQKKNARKCYGRLVRIYNRVTVPTNYGDKAKQKFEAFGWICISCQKIIYDEDIKNIFQYLANRHR